MDYDALPAIVDAREAMTPEAPLVWAGCAGNLALTCEVGDREATDRAFATAAHVVRFEGWAHRVTGTPMEPRSVLGEYDPAAGRYTLRTTTGAGVVRTRERLASILGVPLEKCRCAFGDMGGNFGTRNAFYPEYALLPWAARKVGRPVRWTASRLECFMTDYQARDLASRAELALDESGNFLALRGMRTMGVRMKQHETATLAVTQWLAARPEVQRVLYPALPGDPGYALWQRDFSGASGLFSIELKPCSTRQLAAMLDDYAHFGLGYSWGGFESLVAPAHIGNARTVQPWRGGPLVRYHIGLEDVDDLIRDLETGFSRLAQV